MKFTNFLILCFLFSALISCSPKLNFTEINERINAHHAAFNENDAEYEFKNTPKKYIKEYGEDGFRKRIQKIFILRKNNKYPPYFYEIGELKIQYRNKCNSTYYYNVKYILDKAQITPYLDSTALKLNYKLYGKENVHFNPNAKILETRLRKKGVLILDRDREWKFINYSDSDMQFWDRYFGEGFSECLESNINNSEYRMYY